MGSRAPSGEQRFLFQALASASERKLLAQESGIAAAGGNADDEGSGRMYSWSRTVGIIGALSIRFLKARCRPLDA